MRNENEIMELILQRAGHDESIRAVVLNGSRANPDSTQDEFCDYDIAFVVRNIQSFLAEKDWPKCFGEILIMQMPEDWYNRPYDYNGNEPFAYLMQFADGVRIDLTIVDEKNIASFSSEKEHRRVLLNKDNNEALVDVYCTDVFNVKKPSEKEFRDTVNEFLWISLYVVKGICREELCYAKTFMDLYQMNMLKKMLRWKVGVDTDFSVSTGKADKYFKRFLSEAHMQKLAAVYANGEFKDMGEKLLQMFDFFHEVADQVSQKLAFSYDKDELRRVKSFASELLKKHLNSFNPLSGKGPVGAAQ